MWCTVFPYLQIINPHWRKISTNYSIYTTIYVDMQEILSPLNGNPSSPAACTSRIYIVRCGLFYLLVILFLLTAGYAVYVFPHFVGYSCITSRIYFLSSLSDILPHLSDILPHLLEAESSVATALAQHLEIQQVHAEH